IMAPKRRATTTTTTTPITDAQLKTLIAQGVADVLAERNATRSRNGEDSQDSGTSGIEGVVELTQWFKRMETVFRISNCTTNLKKKMTDKYCPRAEIKKLEVEMWNLKVKGTDVVGYNQRFQELALMCVRMFPEESDKIKKYVGGLPDMIYGSVMASKPNTMQDAIEFTTELMDKKISTLVECQAENRRKLDNNNQAQQQPPKKQGVAIAYADGSGERKEYAGTLPLCNKCKFHHNGQCTIECANCKIVSHLTRDCTRARGMVHALGGGETNQDLNDMEDDINEGLCHAESSHHVTFVNESILTYILEKQSSGRRHLIQNPKPRSRDTSLVALGQSTIKLARQKSYANLKRKPMEFQVGDRVMLKVSPWKGVVRFGKRGKLNPRYVGPFKVLEKVGAVAYKLKLPQELSRVHNMFHVSNLKKCYADEPLAIPLDGLHIYDKLHFVEELVEIMDREVKRLRQSRVPIFKETDIQEKELKSRKQTIQTNPTTWREGQAKGHPSEEIQLEGNINANLKLYY
ncbi:putative reverse transcriptase domain-containing protein, partial [Tanacetum coccineum]